MTIIIRSPPRVLLASPCPLQDCPSFFSISDKRFEVASINLLGSCGRLLGIIGIVDMLHLKPVEKRALHEDERKVAGFDRRATH